MIRPFRLRYVGPGILMGLLPVGVHGMQVSDYDPLVNDRFVAGYHEGQITTPPTPNTSPSFLGYGHDLSGVGWNTLDSTQSYALIMPNVFVYALHYLPNNDSNSVTFLGNNGQLYSDTIAHFQAYTDMVDVAFARLASPIPASAQVNYFSIIDKGDAAFDYNGSSMLVYGKSAMLGTATIISAAWSANGVSTYSFDNVGVRSGDSGSPGFILEDGEIYLSGTRWTTNSFVNYSGGADGAWINPYAIARVNGVMQTHGFAAKVYALPTKTWTGGSGTGGFSTAGNWAEDAAPDREGIAFDAASANGQHSISLGGTPSIKGITFTPSSGDGFTFEAGSTLYLGTGGIVNNSPQTQIFNSNIAMKYVLEVDTSVDPVNTGGQHWSANSGDLIINGKVTTWGFRLVVDGSRDTTINGVIEWGGGVSKEGEGKLTLTAANTYYSDTVLSNGTLAVNNASGWGTGTNANSKVVVWGGRLQGSGSIIGKVQFNRDGVLAPGNSDLDQRGVLTINNGIQMIDQASIEFHLDGLAAGVEYDQLLVTGGDVALNDSLLSLNADNFDASTSSTLWLINNTGSGQLLGQFQGLGNGAVALEQGGYQFRVYYGADAGTGELTGGNDLALAVAVPEPLSVCGAAGGGLWVLLRRRRRD